MTRYLSESLGAPEPYFRNGLKRLEALNGNPSYDIRLTTQILRETQEKIRALGLDPHNTTPAELYHILMERVKVDDARLKMKLRTLAASNVSAEADMIDGVLHILKNQPLAKECFAIKPSKVKSILRKIPPKKVMKQLGYRSIDSFLKHESIPAALTAAAILENKTWHRQLFDAYALLKPSDFESRKVTFFTPTTGRWLELADKSVAAAHHNLFSFREIGSIVAFKLPKDVPAGSATVCVSLALHELNEIRAASTYLKLCQVRPDFGTLVKSVAESEPVISSKQLDQDVPWHLIQRYYAKLSDELKTELFEPHIHDEDMSWQNLEAALVAIEPSLAFWKGSAHLGQLQNHQSVSLNILDAALNLCNNLPYEKRLTQSFNRSLWHELLLKYLNHDTVEQTVLNQLQPQLAAEAVVA